MIIAETDIFGKEKKKRKRKTEYSGKRSAVLPSCQSVITLSTRITASASTAESKKVEIDKVMKDYIKIEYAGKSNLYILATQLDVLQKYAERMPKSRSSTSWAVRNGIRRRHACGVR